MLRVNTRWRYSAVYTFHSRRYRALQTFHRPIHIYVVAVDLTPYARWPEPLVIAMFAFARLDSGIILLIAAFSGHADWTGSDIHVEVCPVWS